MDPRCTAVCAPIFPAEEYRIAELSVSTAALFTDQTFRGRCLVTLREHYTELYQLTPAMRTAFIADVTRLAEAVAKALRPIKMNYDLLGNQVPHMHWHIIPRFQDDGLYPRPIWAGERPQTILPEAERGALIAAIRRHLT